MPVIKQQTKETRVDAATGEIVQSKENRTLQFAQEPQYVKLYIKDILYLSDLPKTHDKVLFALLKHATWAGQEDGMIISLATGLKRMIAKKIGYKNLKSMDNVLSDLVKGDILRRVETGVYQLNPWLFGKGDWQDVEQIRMTFEYTLAGRTFRSMLLYKGQEQPSAGDEPQPPASPDEAEAKTA